MENLVIELLPADYEQLPNSGKPRLEQRTISQAGRNRLLQTLPGKIRPARLQTLRHQNKRGQTMRLYRPFR